MAGETGRPPASIINETDPVPSQGIEKELLTRGASFSFFQAMRLLRHIGQMESNFLDPETAKRGNVRVRPKLSLAFPPADLDRIEKKTHDHRSIFQITANFLGMYGVSSPLPAFYTEDLIDESSEDRSVSRDFLDIVNHRIYELFFQCLVKYRQYIQVAEENDESHIQRLYSLVGLSEKILREGIPDARFLLRYIGLFTQFPRSAAGLKTLIGDALGEVPVDVIPCMKRQVKIPDDQRICLGRGEGGCALGNGSFLGEEIEDRGGKFRLSIGPMDIHHFQRCFPGGEGYRKILLLTRFYMTDPFTYDIELILKKGEKKTAALGQTEWSSLGLNTWIFSGEDTEESRSILTPYQGTA